MASRLYCTPRLRYACVEALGRGLGVLAWGTPRGARLLAGAVTGLLLLEARPTPTRVARFLPGRCHDALNRLYRLMPGSSRARMGLLIAAAKRLGQAGYLGRDDVSLEKAVAQRLAWSGWTYSLAKKRKGYGRPIVVLGGCPGAWRLPVGWRRGRPQRRWAKHRSGRKLELALEWVSPVVAARLPVP